MSGVSVIVPARDAAATLPWVLSGLADQDYAGEWEVLVVDNGSADATGTLARASPLVSRVLRIEGQGPADSRNAGADASHGRWLAFLDSDCRPTPSWLSSGLRELADADLVQGATLPDPEAAVGPFDRTLSVGQFTGLFETANLFVARETFERLGGFQHWLGVGQGNARPFGEDVAFGWRARRLGARIVFSPDVLVHHAVFQRTAAAYAAERLRLRFFPALAREIPELRDHFFYRSWFLSRRSAAFDLAILGCVLAAAGRRPAGFLAATPYLRLEAERCRRWGRRAAVTTALADLAADAVGLGALVAGSVGARSAVL